MLNALHDKAFEAGYLTITPDYILIVSPQILKQQDSYASDFFGKYHEQPIRLPSRFLPDAEFLKYHNEERFMA